MIQVDTREHASEWERISKQFDSIGVEYFRSKLYVGDYVSLDKPRLVIDRKRDLLELCGNVTQQHERFRNELIRAQQAGIKIIILIEHGNGIERLEDIYFWVNPRLKKNPKATKGTSLYRSLLTIRDKYGVQFEFCDKRRTGKVIAELLGEKHG